MTTDYRPHVQHAGCGGGIETTRLITDKGMQTLIFCSRCDCVITDPMQLVPRGTGHEKEPEPIPYTRAEL